jgi:hypothetical protein
MVGCVVDAELTQAIHDAFPVDGPPARPVTGHRCPECDDIDAILGGRTWTEIAADFPPYCQDAFPLLTPAAQAYYLPAYMLTALTPESGLQGTSLETALEDGRLSPEEFTAAQRGVILRWAQVYWPYAGGVVPPAQIVERWQP